MSINLKKIDEKRHKTSEASKIVITDTSIDAIENAKKNIDFNFCTILPFK